jgi:hypothetical protein
MVVTFPGMNLVIFIHSLDIFAEFSVNIFFAFGSRRSFLDLLMR